MLWAHALIVGVLVGTEAFFTGLSEANLRHSRRALDGADAEALADLGVDDPGDVWRYTRDRSRLGALEAWTVLAAVLGLLYTGFLGELARIAEALLLGPVATGVAALVGFAALLALIRVPFSYASTFAVEERHGFNRRSRLRWLRDVALQTAIGLGVVAVVAAGLLGLLEVLPAWWWLAGAGFYVAFVLAAQIVYPRWIAPLFFDFAPVEDDELRDAVADVLEQAGVAFEGIYVMDASTRTAHANAYFVGFGGHKRIVLYDTMIESMTTPQIQAVLAHELAHWTRRHVWKNVALSAAGVAVTLLFLDLLMAWPSLTGMFGLPATSYLGLLVGGIWLAPLRRWLSPVSSWFSRQHEREADDVARRIVGGGEPLADALVELTSDNKSNPYPHPWYVAFHASHPPLPERIERLGGV